LINYRDEFVGEFEEYTDDGIDRGVLSLKVTKVVNNYIELFATVQHVRCMYFHTTSFSPRVLSRFAMILGVEAPCHACNPMSCFSVELLLRPFVTVNRVQTLKGVQQH
jgi:hypothetical protein